MDNIEQRLEKLFATVFPDLSTERIRNASVNSVKSWDSVTAITLLTLIEEEFGIRIDFRGDIDRLTSFMSIAEYLTDTCPAVTPLGDSASFRSDARIGSRTDTTAANGSIRGGEALPHPAFDT